MLPAVWALDTASVVGTAWTPGREVAALAGDIPELGQDPLDFALSRGLPLREGLVLEFGVYSGRTANQIARLRALLWCCVLLAL